MTLRRVLYLGDPGTANDLASADLSATARWCLLAADGAVLECNVGLPPPATADDQLTVILPGEWVTLLTARVPVRGDSRVLAAIPNLVEDELATAIEDNHYAVGPVLADGERRILVIERALLQRILASLTAAGLVPHALVADILLVPVQQDELTVLEVGERYLAATADRSTVVVGRDQLGLLLGSLLGATPVTALRVLDSGQIPAFWRALASERGIPNVRLEICADAMAVLGAQVGRGGHINLLCGEFAPVSHSRRGRALATGAVAAAVVAVLQVGYLAIAGWHFNREAQAVQREAEAVYRQIFPGDRKLVNLRAQAEGHLQAARGGADRQQLLAQLHAFGPVWRAVAAPEAVIHSLRYDGRDHTLNIDISATSVQEIEKLTAALRDAKLVAKLLSAQGEGNGVRAKLVLGGDHG